MKKRLAHLLPLSETEENVIWNDGILTVDTNVLLDLYRLHSDSRDSLLDAIRSFKDRAWLTYQAGREFTLHRHDVMRAFEKELQDAERDLSKHSSEMRGALNKKCRPLPKDFIAEATNRLEEIMRDVRKQAEDVRKQRAAEVGNDSVLSAVLDIFDGRIGDEPTSQDLETAHKEAAGRIARKVPPGYMDQDKDGEKRYGDYLIWREILKHAKDMGKPIIFVTSERKGDWWAIRSGEIVGPRPELLEEAHQVARQRVLILHTESFIRKAARRNGETLSKLVVADLQMWTGSRPHVASGSQLDEIVEGLLNDAAFELMNSGTLINSRIAETNASDWDVESIGIITAGPFNYEDCTAPFRATMHLSGEQDSESMWCGTSITATVTGVVQFDGEQWTLLELDVVGAEIDSDSDEFDEVEPD